MRALREAADAFMRESTARNTTTTSRGWADPSSNIRRTSCLQELIWALQPDLVVETGIAHGGSLILWSSLLELNAACGGPPDARVVG